MAQNAGHLVKINLSLFLTTTGGVISTPILPSDMLAGKLSLGKSKYISKKKQLNYFLQLNKRIN
jgi:hypothetical protein